MRQPGSDGWSSHTSSPSCPSVWPRVSGHSCKSLKQQEPNISIVWKQNKIRSLFPHSACQSYCQSQDIFLLILSQTDLLVVVPANNQDPIRGNSSIERPSPTLLELLLRLQWCVFRTVWPHCSSGRIASLPKIMKFWMLIQRNTLFTKKAKYLGTQKQGPQWWKGGSKGLDLQGKALDIYFHISSSIVL